jgi:hypothetical protein
MSQAQSSIERQELRTEEPELSIVIAIIAGGSEPCANCLAALMTAGEQHHVEYIVPYDYRLPDVGDLSRKFPRVDFIDARVAVPPRSEWLSREHHDILRAIGLSHARGRIVALLEDHEIPSDDWIAATIDAHRSNVSAVGGAVENGVDRILNWAVYYCDFGRFQNPVDEGQVEFLSDTNVSYKREVLHSVKSLWAHAYHETSVNWELRRRGETLRLNPRMVVHQQRSTLRLPQALRERYVWGRSFAGTRATEVSSLKRITFAAFSFLLPLLLTSRILMRGLGKRRHLVKLLTSLPLVFLLEVIWSVGEFVGYATKRTGEPQRLQAPQSRLA